MKLALLLVLAATIPVAEMQAQSVSGVFSVTDHLRAEQPEK
jgi:hypothetical protein